MRRSWRVSSSPLDVGGGSSWLSPAQANRCDKSDCWVIALQDRKSSCRTDSLHLLLEETIAVRMFASRECRCRFHWSSFDAKVEADFGGLDNLRNQLKTNQGRDIHAFHDDCQSQQRLGSRHDAERRIAFRDGQIQRGADESGSVAGPLRAPAQFQRGANQIFGKQEDGCGWSFYRK